MASALPSREPRERAEWAGRPQGHPPPARRRGGGRGAPAVLVAFALAGRESTAWARTRRHVRPAEATPPGPRLAPPPRAPASRVPCFCPHRFALASHFFWGLWSIIQAKISSIEFGYMVRLGQFLSSTSRGKCHSVCGRLTVNDCSLQRVTRSPQVPEPGDLAPRPRAQPWKPREEGRRVQASCSGGALCLRSAQPQAQQGPPLPQGSAARSGPRVRVLWPLQKSRHPGPRGPTPDLGAPERLVHP